MLEKIKWICFLIYMVIMIAGLGWFLISYLDVVVHNLQTGYEYPSWNLFTLLIEKN